MHSQMDYAKAKKLTPEMKAVAKKEGIPTKKLMHSVARGETVIVKNKKRKISPIAIGSAVRVKINANVGASPHKASARLEKEKALLAENYGADTIMDLSVGGNLKKIRKEILSSVKVPLGTVPVYEVCYRMQQQNKNLLEFTSDDFFKIIESQLSEGVDFVTVHAGVTQNIVKKYSSKARLAGIVSRGGALLAKWMQLHGEENPLYKEFDYLLELAYEYNAVLSLGDGLRPGALKDSNDFFQIAELKALGELVERARDRNAQTIIEGPGHVPIDRIKENVLLEKKYCKNAPFYVLGPLVTDIGAGYDHLTASIGGAIAALHGADFLCYVTPSEHLALPNKQDVIDGTIATKLAAHAVNITRFPEDRRKDNEMSSARAALNWNKMFSLSLNPENAKRIRYRDNGKKDVCSMCGEFCPIKISKK